MALEEEEGGLTFSLDVGGDGATALRNTIMNKLSDFMGSYTDDVLAEYVVVLVSHGKQQAQAVKDLEAFLGDQSESFVTWLWEHLAANMHLYTTVPNDLSTKPDLVDVEPFGQSGNEEVTRISTVTTQWKDKSHDTLPPRRGGRLISLKSNTTRSDAGSATIRATQVDASGLVRSLNGSARGTKRQRSPDSGLQSERGISEKQKAPRVSVTMRLLQSAVREAVAPTSGYSKRSAQEAAAPVRETRVPMREVRTPVRVSTAPTGSHPRLSESSLKRLQSVVSADHEHSEGASVQQPLKDARRPYAAQQGKKAMPAIMMAMKAAAAAAEDVTKVRGRLGGNIWDRLGKKAAEYKDSDDEEDVRYGGDENKEALENRLEDRYTSHYYEDEYDHRKRRLESDDVLSEGSIEDGAVVSGSHFDEYTGQSISSRNVYSRRADKYHEESRSGENFVNDDTMEDGEDIRSDRRRLRKEESVTVEYRLARNTEGVKKESHKPKGSSASSGLANSSQKIVNISVNVNTWKPEAYDKVKDTGGSEQPALILNQEQSQEQMNKGFTSDMIGIPPGNDMEEDGAGDLHDTTSKPVRELQSEANELSAKPLVTTKEAPKAVSSAVSTGVKPVRKVDDAESRTVFVTNIHFAASKESVMAHFAPCGDIGRIVMLTDGATGQPKGSAYIEFKAKEATDRALALNDSSFYSRALKVVRKDAAIQAIQEINPLIHPALIRRSLPLALRLPIGARLFRGAPYLVQRRFPTMPRPYGNFPSLQWKRDGPPVGNVIRPGFNMPVRPPPRINSYVRSSGPPQLLKPGEDATLIPAQGVEEVKAEGGAKEQKDVQME